MSRAGQGSEGDMKRGRGSTAGGGPLDHVLEKGTAGPIVQSIRMRICTGMRVI